MRLRLVTLSLGVASLLAPLAVLAEEHAGPAWSYTGEAGPAAWGKLAPDFHVCADGKAQSPVDLAGAFAYELADPVFEYTKAGTRVINDGHSLQVPFEPGNHLELDGRSWELVQMHVHVPSEHAIEGQRFPAEAHFVHRDADGKLAVVGVMLWAASSEVEAKPWPFPAKLPAKKGETTDLVAPLDPSKLLPDPSRSYRYDGSLTTPPCSEGVRWTVMKDPIAIPEASLEALEAVLHENSRPLQPRGDRGLVIDGSN